MTYKIPWRVLWKKHDSWHCIKFNDSLNWDLRYNDLMIIIQRKRTWWSWRIFYKATCFTRRDSATQTLQQGVYCKRVPVTIVLYHLLVLAGHSSLGTTLQTYSVWYLHHTMLHCSTWTTQSILLGASRQSRQRGGSTTFYSERICIGHYTGW